MCEMIWLAAIHSMSLSENARLENGPKFFLIMKSSMASLSSGQEELL